ncbi:E3 ubiquitin-protein ligase RNF180 [Gastrophryne carolinensis]
MTHKDENFLLRCWKCRKPIGDSECLVQDDECKHCQGGINSSVYRDACSIWHLEAEASPDWIKDEIEKADWTTSKLNCPYCKTRLGAFNFVNTTKCSCGHLIVIRLCKSKIDVGFPVSPPSLVFPSKLHNASSTTAGCTMKEPLESIQNQTVTVNQYKVPSEINLDALCLEILKSRELLEQNSRTASKNIEKKKHRKSRSLDLDLRDWQKENYSRPSDMYSSAAHSSGSSRSLIGIAEPSRNIREVFYSSPDNIEVLREGISNSHSPSLSIVLPTSSSLSEGVQFTEREASAQVLLPVLSSSTATIQTLTKREKNKQKSLRRKQRKRERRLHENRQINKTNLSSDEEEEENIKEKEGYICAVCLDIYFNPYMCHPCQHIFCELCLRMLAKDNPSKTHCPLCRAIIAKVYFQTELSNSSADFFPNEYLKRRQSFQTANCAKWPLPSCSRPFRMFGGFRRHLDPTRRRYFPHGGHRFDFEDESHGWRFNLDMIIIYIFSVNWVIVFIFCCLLGSPHAPSDARVSLDSIVELPTFAGNNITFVAVHRFTKIAHFICLTGLATAFEFATLFIWEII